MTTSRPARKPAPRAPVARDPASLVASPIPAPRFEFLWASLVFLIAMLALGFPALGGAFLINDHSDQLIGGFPVRDFAAMSLKAGKGIPLWNPYIMGGLPYVAAMHGDIFYPTALLRALLPTDVAMTWSFMIHLFLAGLFTFGFLRAWGISFYAALLGGFAYMMCGPIAAYVSPGHDGKLFVSALLPLALWMLVRGIRDGRAWSWGVLAITVGLGVLSPHPQLLQYMLLTCGAFSFYLAFGSSASSVNGVTARLDRGVALRRLGFALGAVLLGALMGAVQYMPVREYVAFSPRAGGRDYAYSTSYSLPLEETINFYLPQFSGILDHYWGRNGIHFHSEYLGAATLFLGGLGLASPRRSFRWFWIGTFVVALFWSLGGSTPFYYLVYAIVPGSKFFRAPSTMLFVVAFATSVLAALGVERLLQRDVSGRYLLGWLGAAAAVALLATAGALTGLARIIASGYAADQLDGVIAANAGALTLGAWRSFLAVGACVGVAWLIRQRRISLAAASVSLVAIVGLDLLSVEKQYWIFGEPASVLYGSDRAVEYLTRIREPGRVLALRGKAGALRDPMLQGDGLMVHGIRQVTGYHGNEPGRFQAVCGGSASAACRPEVLFDPMFWRHENVQYLYTDFSPRDLADILRPTGMPEFQLLVGPVKGVRTDTVYLYKLPGANPVAWTATAFVKAPADQALAVAIDPRFDPLRVATLDSSSAITAQALSAAPAPLDVAVRAERYEPGVISLTLASSPPAGSALVVSENYFTGWTATVDGKPALVDRADYNLIGVQLPANARRVELRYDDPAYESGKVVTLVAVGLGLALIVLGAILDRRRLTPDTAGDAVPGRPVPSVA